VTIEKSGKERNELTFSMKNRIMVPENILFRELEGESVILNLDSESYLGLDDVGTRMWAVLTTSDSIQAAFETLQHEYEVEPDVLRTDLSDLIEKLVENGLVRVVDASSLQKGNKALV
jgi:hypothetical protein